MLAMVAVGVRSVAVEVVVVVAVGSGGVLCVVLAFFLSGVWSADVTMASLISFSVSLQASADDVRVARSCADNWLTVSSAGDVDGGMAETAMASLISSSYSLYTSADAVSAARSCADNW